MKTFFTQLLPVLLFLSCDDGGKGWSGSLGASDHISWECVSPDQVTWWTFRENGTLEISTLSLPNDVDTEAACSDWDYPYELSEDSLRYLTWPDGYESPVWRSLGQFVYESRLSLTYLSNNDLTGYLYLKPVPYTTCEQRLEIDALSGQYSGQLEWSLAGDSAVQRDDAVFFWTGHEIFTIRDESDPWFFASCVGVTGVGSYPLARESGWVSSSGGGFDLYDCRLHISQWQADSIRGTILGVVSLTVNDHSPADRRQLDCSFLGVSTHN